MRNLCVFGFGVVCAALAVTGCTSEPSAVQCATGIVCPAGMQCGAVQRVCLFDSCGNGVKDQGEECDDGNILTNDGCSADCKFERCGNGITDPGEECDDGNNASGDGCFKCRQETCGNSRVDLGEECDDGNLTPGDGCSATCKVEFCGDGKTNDQTARTHEDCDAGGVNSATCNFNCTTATCGDRIVNFQFTAPGAPGPEQCDPPSEGMGCSPQCRFEHCGNHFVDPGEQCDDGNAVQGDDCFECRFEECGNFRLDPRDECDDGNLTPGDGCSATCKREFCGDDIVNNRTEQCDPGAAGETATCNRDCTLRSCGDGKINRAAGEQCDHGTGVNADNADCTADCQINVCGDGRRNTVGPLHREGCDDGNRNDRDDCTNACIAKSCGDGIVGPDEECDLGANNSDTGACLPSCLLARCGDGRVLAGVEECDGGPSCSADCHFQVCGNGILDPGEDCDDRNVTSGDGCSATCKREFCGDGKTNDQTARTHEDCDDGGANSATCNFNCTTAKCGDRIVNFQFTVPGAPGPEQCDPPSEGMGCSAQCRFEHCGNSVVDPGEQCDDGNAVKGDGCFDCRREECGNFRLDPGDECDDGNLTPGDGCSATCKREFCGDDIVNNRTEECDPGAAGETATCNRDCTLRSCGDGKINRAAGEQCDHGTGVNADNADCTADCQINVCGDGRRNTVGPLHREGCDDGNRNDRDDCTNACIAKLCGDGIVGPDEECDLGANNTDTGACLFSCLLARCGDGKVQAGVEECDSTRGCSPTCRIEKCGNGVLDPGEQCDDGPGKNGAGQRCNAACQFNVCGDGDRAGSEQCDDGAAGIPKDTTTCDTDCSFAVCGDGHLNTAAGEVCDDGLNNGKPGDPCSLTCQTVTCGNGVLEQGEECDDGPGNGPDRRCTACKLNVCGDGHVLIGVEQCDDGVQGVAQDTATCDRDCTAVVCGDGHLNPAAGELCDHGSNNGTPGDTCDAFCHLVACGNGFVDRGEQCDPGTGEPATDGATCDADCTAVVCGDGHVNAAASEVCDDGPSNGDPCRYNDRSCVRCNSTCTAVTQPGGPFCGDSVVSNGEVCDQGLLRNGQPCAYGDRDCLSGTDPVCNIDCSGFVIGPNGPFCGDSVVQGQYREQCDPGGVLLTPSETATCDRDCTFAFCGDGHANPAAGEACDDGNADACGTCSAACGAPVTAAAAAGAIVVSPAGGADVTDGDTLTLGDGVAGHPEVVFELDNDGRVAPGRVAIAFTDATSSTELAAVLRDAINAAASLDITATVDAATVPLVNDHRSAHGNQPIGRTGTIAIRFTFHDLADGAAGDCAAGIGCVSNDDCSSGVCNAAAGRCQ